MFALVLVLCFQQAFAWPFNAVSLAQRDVDPSHHPHPPGSPEFWTKLFISVVLVLAGGVFAGYASCPALIVRL
jgi:hypothetical protein